jgi:hypothetical protein
MEPIHVNVNVTVEFSPKAEQFLTQLFKGSEAPAQPTTPTSEKPSKPVREVVSAAIPEAHEDAAAAITDADLRQAVKAAKDKAGAKPVREIFAAMGIASSVDCPAERRSELMAALQNI